MSLIPESEVREVYEITNEQKQSIIDFLQGAVYCWCKNRPDEWFSMRNLMGGDNFNWKGTPLFTLYKKHRNNRRNNQQAIDLAGKDSGWLLKRVISDDNRKFETKKEEQIRKYLWIRED